MRQCTADAFVLLILYVHALAFSLTLQATSPKDYPSANYDRGAILTDTQLPLFSARYTLVSHFVVSERTVNGQTQQEVHHLTDVESVEQMQRRLELSSMASGTLALLGSRPGVDVYPNAQSWSRIFEQTSGDHQSSSDDDHITPIQRYRLSFTGLCPGPAFEGMITRWTAAERAAKEASGAEHSTLWIVEDNGYIRDDDSEKRSTLLQTKYEWRRATREQLESVRSMYKEAAQD